jgi:hypothetical protein
VKAFRGIGGPSSTDQSEIFRWFLAKFVVGSATSAPPSKPDGYGNYEPATFSLELVGAQPIIRGLELTTPQLASTKLWLHGWPFRFNPGKRQFWDISRSNPTWMNSCKPQEDHQHDPQRGRCLHQLWSIDQYVTCRVAANYDLFREVV